ncbi:2-polyprenyl-3-methyl-6-methoxy-1,4-benzoquinone monooxygenase [Thiohalobacter thiocyanaticus]|uniref:3-demethoxyubiquinol 3-hydroxylase n=1 Tax=Thiohalobacter thiocyanaticus TaxID=585455 RepID=A0A426QKL0_9GAMM|nr:2-polyprenyl-3-methyl-6-methoxy-1,4-benzoquinone monooxygenase [Thiohalobacter thiocyanaticus]RRQ22280.1 2-polyprenyl-3-methyl-6-methoxy-1,4-benzoquinone monooxygenase [Thiohalobacter thiocyanaticus]
MTSERSYSPFDHLIANFDQALRTLFGRPDTTGRPDPSASEPEAELAETERVESARLMRVNHTGEVCAQALYQGQALTAKLEAVRENMERAAREENDHLVWCEHRIEQLGGHTSYLNPFFYAGAFSIGAAAGAVGDKWSLGFVGETEKQVIAHLDGHLQRIASNDHKSRAILEQMRVDEAQHGHTAMAAGGAPLPGPIRLAMRLSSKVMTGTTYWV